MDFEVPRNPRYKLRMENDELPKALIERYLDRRVADVEVLEASLTSGSGDEFRRIGHQLAGNLSSFGFAEAEGIAREMEALLDSEVREKGQRLLADFKAWLQTHRPT